MFLKAKRWEMYTGSENLCLCQYAHTTYTINLHFHIGVTVWVP